MLEVSRCTVATMPVHHAICASEGRVRWLRVAELQLFDGLVIIEAAVLICRVGVGVQEGTVHGMARRRHPLVSWQLESCHCKR